MMRSSRRDHLTGSWHFGGAGLKHQGQPIALPLTCSQRAGQSGGRGTVEEGTFKETAAKTGCFRQWQKLCFSEYQCEKKFLCAVSYVKLLKESIKPNNTKKPLNAKKNCFFFNDYKKVTSVCMRKIQCLRLICKRNMTYCCDLQLIIGSLGL